MSSIWEKAYHLGYRTTMPGSVPLPARWGRAQRIKNTVIYVAIVVAVACARALPLWVLRALGRAGAALGWVFAFADRARATRQLRQSMPELRQPWRVTLRMFLHLGSLAAEWVKIERYTTPKSALLDFPAEAQAVLRDALAEGNGVLCVTPHLGNWELLAQAATRHGIPCTTIAKPLYDPRLTGMVDDFRGRSGLVTLWRGDGELRARLAAVLQQKSLLGVLIDQDTQVAHVFVPFFGKLAATPIVPQRLAVQHGCAVVFCYAVRIGKKYRIHCERVPVPTADDPALALTAELNKRTEAAIRQWPEQWMWLHRRWKTRPPGEQS